MPMVVLNPKERFLKKEEQKMFLQALSGNPVFMEAVEAALCQMTISQIKTLNPTEAATLQWRREGALEFLSILLNIGLADVKPAGPAPRTLTPK